MLFTEDVAYVMSLLKLELTEKLEIQGHGKRATSKLIQSIESEVEALANVTVGRMYMNDYYVYIEHGIKAGKIPYRGRTGKGGTSRYIEGLIKHFQLKGKGRKESKRAAFATANVQKKEGMPTRNSYKYSQDGTRLGFLSSTLIKNENAVNDILERRTGSRIELLFTEMIKKYAA